MVFKKYSKSIVIIVLVIILIIFIFKSNVMDIDKSKSNFLVGEVSSKGELNISKTNDDTSKYILLGQSSASGGCATC